MALALKICMEALLVKSSSLDLHGVDFQYLLLSFLQSLFIRPSGMAVPLRSSLHSLHLPYPALPNLPYPGLYRISSGLRALVLLLLVVSTIEGGVMGAAATTTKKPIASTSTTQPRRPPSTTTANPVDIKNLYYNGTFNDTVSYTPHI